MPMSVSRMPLNNLIEDDVSDNGSQSVDEYEVDQILGMRVLEDGTEEFKVRWKNYGSDDDTWEPKENLMEGAKDTLNKFLQSNKAKKHGKKMGKASRTPNGTKARKRTADENEREDENGGGDGDSNEDESSDNDFSGSSASKKKKTMGKKQKKKPPSGRMVTSSASRPTPHNGDALTMAINRRMNLGQHSSWLESGSESDSNVTTTKKGRTAGGGGKGGTTERRAARKSNDNDRAENGKTVPTDNNKHQEDAGRISDDNATTEKLANSPSPNFDVEADVVGNEPLNMPSEHDPPPLDLSAILNGAVAKYGTKEKTKRVEQTMSKGPRGDTLHFDGIYLDGNDGWKLGVRSGDDPKDIRVFTFEEARDTDAIGLCDFLRGLIKFTEEKNPRIEVTQRVEEENGTRDDDKLNFDE